MRVGYKILIDNTYEISIEEACSLIGVSKLVIDMLAKQDISQYLPDGRVLIFKK